MICLKLILSHARYNLTTIHLNNMTNNVLLLSLIFISSFSVAQTSTLMTHSEPIDEKRYGAVTGSPYLFKSNVVAKIITAEGELINDVEVNYNGESQGIEVYKADRMTTLNSEGYPRVIIEKHGIKKGVDGPLQLVTHPNFKNAYVMEIYNGSDASVYRKFRVSINSVETNLPGETVKKEKFTPKNEYFIIIDGNSTTIKRKDKEFIKILGHEKELKSYLKKNKNKLKSDQDIIKLMQYYESII